VYRTVEAEERKGIRDISSFAVPRRKWNAIMVRAVTNRCWRTECRKEVKA